MDSRSGNNRIGTFQLWVLVFLLLFLALCGVHLFVLHQIGDAHAIELANGIELALVGIALVALAHHRHCVTMSQWRSTRGDIAVILRTITAPTPETFPPIRT